jgi:hypothetical protein
MIAYQACRSISELILFCLMMNRSLSQVGVESDSDVILVAHANSSSIEINLLWLHARAYGAGREPVIPWQLFP